ncbi:MAG: hypothetical protein ACRC2U_20925 [Aeromonas sp.]
MPIIVESPSHPQAGTDPAVLSAIAAIQASIADIEAQIEGLNGAVGQAIAMVTSSNQTNAQQNAAIAALQQTQSNNVYTRVVNPAWFNTGFDTGRYDRPIDFGALTELSFEFKSSTGTVHPFVLNDFVTGFKYSTFWNGDSNPSGITRFVNTGISSIVIPVVFNDARDRITIAGVQGSQYLQIRKVKINGQPMDWLLTYDPQP